MRDNLSALTARQRMALRYTLAVLGCAAATATLLLLPRQLWLSSGVLLYLLTVLVVSSLAGRGPGITASVLSFLAFNFAFTEPRLTFTIDDPAEWFALIAYLLVALATSHLAAGQREQLHEAQAREREARLLHDLADLLAGRSLQDAVASAAERIRQELGADAIAVAYDVQGTAGRAEAGDPEALSDLRAAGPVSMLGGGHPASATQSGTPGMWIRIRPPTPPGRRHPRNVGSIPIRQDEQTLGKLLVKWPHSEQVGRRQARLLDTAADQLASALEREGLRIQATEAEVLRRTSELKSALLDAVSHDLRTPLASIIASAGSLRQADVEWTSDERRDFARTIEQEAERLNRIVGNLLDLTRIQGGTLVPARGWHDPSLVLGESVERLRGGIVDHRLVTDLPEDLPPVLLDPVEVDQILANLVENAAKYSPPGSDIRVAASHAGRQLTVFVEDTGPGVPSEVLPRLFEPFYRAPSAHAVRGSGLGLAVARGLVDAHGGRIWAENGEVQGARFTFTIPSPPLGDGPD